MRQYFVHSCTTIARLAILELQVFLFDISHESSNIVAELRTDVASWKYFHFFFSAILTIYIHFSMLSVNIIFLYRVLKMPQNSMFCIHIAMKATKMSLH